MRTYWLLLLLLNIIFLAVKADYGAKLTLMLTKFRNSKGRCDPTENNAACDTYFRVCLGDGKTDCTNRGKRSVAKRNMNNLDSADLPTFELPLTKWLVEPPSVLNISVFDENPNKQDQLIVSFFQPLNLTAQPSRRQLYWHVFSDSTKQHELVYQLALQCNKNYYSSTCDVLCLPSPTYSCSDEGEKVCTPGYIGPQCADLHPCNASNPCKNGGVCLIAAESFSCQCTEAYGGALCESAAQTSTETPVTSTLVTTVTSPEVVVTTSETETQTTMSLVVTTATSPTVMVTTDTTEVTSTVTTSEVLTTAATTETPTSSTADTSVTMVTSTVSVTTVVTTSGTSTSVASSTLSSTEMTSSSTTSFRPNSTGRVVNLCEKYNCKNRAPCLTVNGLAKDGGAAPMCMCTKSAITVNCIPTNEKLVIARVFVDLEEFTNADDTNYNGTPCSTSNKASCETFFRLCLGDANGCKYAYFTSRIFNQSNGITAQRLGNFDLTRWPPSALFVHVNAIDWDASNGHTQIVNYSQPISLNLDSNNKPTKYSNNKDGKYLALSIGAKCSDGYVGEKCEHPCRVNNTCKNGAECVASGANYSCRCTPQYTGRWCESLVDPCSFSPCLNGGTCFSSGLDWLCVCESSFFGTNCQHLRTTTTTSTTTIPTTPTSTSTSTRTTSTTSTTSTSVSTTTTSTTTTAPTTTSVSTEATAFANDPKNASEGTSMKSRRVDFSREEETTTETATTTREATRKTVLTREATSAESSADLTTPFAPAIAEIGSASEAKQPVDFAAVKTWLIMAAYVVAVIVVSTVFLLVMCLACRPKLRRPVSLVSSTQDDVDAPYRYPDMQRLQRPPVDKIELKWQAEHHSEANDYETPINLYQNSSNVFSNTSKNFYVADPSANHRTVQAEHVDEVYESLMT